MSERLEKPLPPVVIQANHHSIDLQWEHIRNQDENQRLFDEYGSARSGSLIYLQQREKRIGSLWENIYIGSALSFKVNNLKPNTQYEFRIQYKMNFNGGQRSDWSIILQASTTSEPMNADAIFKAITMPGKEQLEKLLTILGSNHPLLEQPDKNGNLPLIHACAKLDISKVELLIKSGANVNSCISSGKTPLIVAASAGFSKACSMLIENGANINILDQNGISLLHHAIDSRNFETVSIIIQQFPEDNDIEINRPVGQHKWTPLYRAIIHDCNKEIIEILLKHGANAQCEDKTTGTTAIQMSVIRGNLNTTQLLVAYGANTKALSKIGGKSLQQLAMSTNKTDLINYVESLPSASKNW